MPPRPWETGTEERVEQPGGRPWETGGSVMTAGRPWEVQGGFAEQYGHEYGVFEYIEPEPRGPSLNFWLSLANPNVVPFTPPLTSADIGEFDWWSRLSMNALNDAVNFLNPRNWAMAAAAIGGAAGKALAPVFGYEGLEEGYWLDPRTGEIRSDNPHDFYEEINYSLFQGPSFPEMGQALIEPYTSFEALGEYMYQHPLQFALDATIVAGGAKSIYKAGAKATERIAFGRAYGASSRLQRAMRAGASNEEIARLRDIANSQLNRLEKVREFVTKKGPLGIEPTPMSPESPLVYSELTAAGVAREGAAELMRDLTRTYGVPPAAEVVAATAIERAPVQRWVDSVVDYWMGQARGYTVDQNHRLKQAFRGINRQNVDRFNSEFLATQQLGYNEAVLDRGIAEGWIMPQTKEVLRVWNEIVDERAARLHANGISSPEAFQEAAELPSKIVALQWDENLGRFTSGWYRRRKAEMEADARMWGISMNDYPLKPVDPLTVRKDLRLVIEHPELFIYDEYGRMVSPRYYPHQMARDTAHGLVKEISEAQLRHGFKEELAKRSGRLFFTGEYEQDVMTALRRNIRRTARHESLYNIVMEVIENYGEKYKKGDPVPEGRRVVYPEGFKVWMTTEFDEQVIKLAREINKKGYRGGLRPYEERVFDNELIRMLSEETGNTVFKGQAYTIPDIVADHIKQHLTSADPFFEVLTDLGGITSFWRNWVLSFRPAWQAVNETTNAVLTAVHGNLTGVPLLREMRRRGIKTPGIISDASIMPEFGEAFGYSGAVQEWLASKGPVGEMALKFNRWLHNTKLSKTGRYLAEFNQMRDNFYKQINFLAEMKREFKSAARAGAGMDVGVRKLTPAEVRNITRTGDLFFDTIEDILKGAGVRGQHEFVREMTAKASECVYSWNAMTPFQRKVLTKTIPFVGWQLFTTGLLFRLPVKYPVRAWLMKSAANIGRDFVDDLFEAHGIDPDTIPEWDITALPIFYDEETGKTLVIRSNFFRLYDMMGYEDISRTILSHPGIQAILGLAGTETFPEYAPFTVPPIDWGKEGQPEKNPLDVFGELFFGSAWTTGTKLAHPYTQYGVGGLVSPEEILVEGELLPYDWRNELSKYITSVSWELLDTYDVHKRAHDRFRKGVDGAFVTLNNLLLDERGQNREEIRATAEIYLMRAYQLLDQIGVLLAMDITDREREILESEMTRYGNQIERVERGVIQFMSANPNMRIQPESIHGETWTAPEQETEANEERQ